MAGSTEIWNCEGPLFVPIAPFLRRLPRAPAVPPEELDGLLPASAVSGGGARVRFVRPPRDRLGYERRVFDIGEVATREGNWHDLFNALVWASFPLTKSALNARHVFELDRHAKAGSGVRGPLRDAATQFDESGVVVASTDAALARLLEQREWVELFWNRRASVLAGMRFFVFGHGLYDSLRRPFVGLCGKAAIVEVDAGFPGLALHAQLEVLDAELARRFSAEGWYDRPAAFATLPVLGIPGALPDNECLEYYLDRRQFKPLPAK